MARVAAVDMRERLIDAAHRVIARCGVAGSTAKEIANEAGVAEGTIYNYFDDKYDLCVAVASRVLPEMVRRLPTAVGRRLPRSVLTEVVDDMLYALQELIPLISGVVGDPELARKLRDRSASESERGATLEGLSAYFAREQAASRIGQDTDPRILARMVLGTAFHHAYIAQAVGEERLDLQGRRFVTSLVDAVLRAAGTVEGTVEG